MILKTKTSPCTGLVLRPADHFSVWHFLTAYLGGFSFHAASAAHTCVWGGVWGGREREMFECIGMHMCWSLSLVDILQGLSFNWKLVITASQ